MDICFPYIKRLKLEIFENCNIKPIERMVHLEKLSISAEDNVEINFEQMDLSRIICLELCGISSSTSFKFKQNNIKEVIVIRCNLPWLSHHEKTQLHLLKLECMEISCAFKNDLTHLIEKKKFHIIAHNTY